MGFTYWGRELEYETGVYNDSVLNERAVEVPIAWDFIARRAHYLDPCRLLEVGNVLGHYFVHTGLVVDLYDESPDVLNADVLNVQGEYDLIVSVSTLEHVHPERATAPEFAVRVLRRCLARGGVMLVTAPLGYRPSFDQAIMDGRLGATRACTMVRGDDNGAWYQTEALQWRPYGPNWAQSVAVMEWEAS